MKDWPCLACGARNLEEGYRRCLDDTDHSDCAHDVLTTPCPMDECFDLSPAAIAYLERRAKIEDSPEHAEHKRQLAGIRAGARHRK